VCVLRRMRHHDIDDTVLAREQGHQDIAPTLTRGTAPVSVVGFATGLADDTAQNKSFKIMTCVCAILAILVQAIAWSAVLSLSTLQKHVSAMHDVCGHTHAQAMPATDHEGVATQTGGHNWRVNQGQPQQCASAQHCACRRVSWGAIVALPTDPLNIAFARFCWVYCVQLSGSYFDD
jgi:hypothetical protein